MMFTAATSNEQMSQEARMLTTPGSDRDSKTPDIVVALDFGTSHSGYAFGKLGLTEALASPTLATPIGSLIHVRDNWPGALSRYSKTLSATLYDYDSQPVAYGDLALVKYLELRGNEVSRHALIRRVKLLLAEDAFYRDPLLTQLQLEPSQIIGDFLSFLKRDAEELLGCSGFLDLKARGIHWVMTVPATWSEKAKSTMVTAAKSAGLLDHRGRVTFCLEPEAAILSCAVTTNLIQHQDRVLVLDMGGGTVDLAAYHVIQSAQGSSWHGLELKQIIPSEGRTCGATFFDDAFLAFFLDLIGVDAVDLATTNSNAPSHLFSQWEHIKRTFQGMLDSVRWIRLDPQLQRLMPQGRVEVLIHQGRYDAQRGEVCLYPKDIISCFEQVYPFIVEITKHMFAKASRAGQSINKLLCVGGFAEMVYMKRRIYETFGSQGAVDVIFPIEAGSCVVQGALLHGIANDSTRLQSSIDTTGSHVPAPKDGGPPTPGHHPMPQTPAFRPDPAPCPNQGNHTESINQSFDMKQLFPRPDSGLALDTGTDHTSQMATAVDDRSMPHDTVDSKKCCECIPMRMGVVTILLLHIALTSLSTFLYVLSSRRLTGTVALFLYYGLTSISLLVYVVLLYAPGASWAFGSAATLNILLYLCRLGWWTYFEFSINFRAFGPPVAVVMGLISLVFGYWTWVLWRFHRVKLADAQRKEQSDAMVELP